MLKEGFPEQNPFTGEIFTEDEEYDQFEIVDQEVADAEGKHCNGYGHMDVTKDELVSQIETFLSDNDVGYTKEEQDCENTRYKSGGSKNEYTYYRGRVDFTIDSDVIQYMIVGYDSVTEEVHELTLNFTGSEKKGHKLLVYCMNWLEKGFGTSHSDDLEDCFIMDDYSFTDVGEYSVYVSVSDYAGQNNYYFCIEARE